MPGNDSRSRERIGSMDGEDVLVERKVPTGFEGDGGNEV